MGHGFLCASKNFTNLSKHPTTGLTFRGCAQLASFSSSYSIFGLEKPRAGRRFFHRVGLPHDAGPATRRSGPKNLSPCFGAKFFYEFYQPVLSLFSSRYSSTRPCSWAGGYHERQSLPSFRLRI